VIEAALADLETHLRAALAARDLDAIARCDQRARALIATALAAPDLAAHVALARLRDLYAELIDQISTHRDALARSLGAQHKRRRDIAAYRR